MANFAKVVLSLREEGARTATQLANLERAIAALGGVVGNGVRRGRRTMSVAARRAVSLQHSGRAGRN